MRHLAGWLVSDEGTGSPVRTAELVSGCLNKASAEAQHNLVLVHQLVEVLLWWLRHLQHNTSPTTTTHPARSHYAWGNTASGMMQHGQHCAARRCQLLAMSAVSALEVTLAAD